MRNEIVETALRLSRRGPVLVTGIAGVGKSWLLRRVAALAVSDQGKRGAAPFAEVEIHDGARRDAMALLADRLVLPDPRRLLILDGIEALVATESPLLDAIACSRGPLLLAAPPAIWDLPAPARGLHAFLAGRCRSLVLPPLSPPDRRALLFPEADPAGAVPSGYAPLALDPAWGGHPRVLEQVRAVLRDPTEAALQRLGDVVSARLPGYAEAILASVGSLEREALLAVARGAAFRLGSASAGVAIGERLRGAALSLTLHGALSRESDGWVLSDQVLERQLVARG